jgi:hypothetical protein
VDRQPEYFLLILDYQKAGSHKLQQRLKRQIEKRADLIS